MKKRALRRHHYNRLKRKVKKSFLGILENDILGFVANTPHCCSCTMCGNPRKHFKFKTKQEILSIINEKEQCEECNVYKKINIPKMD